LAFFLEKWSCRFQPERRSELRVVPDFRTYIQRQMRAVNSDVIFKGELELPMQRSSHRL